MTLTNKLILPVLVGYVLLASAFYFVWAPKQLEQTQTYYLEQQQLVLQSLHTLVKDAVLQQDIDEINLRLDQAWQSYETNWHYLVVEKQEGKPLYSAGSPADETTPFSTTIRKRFLRSGYSVAALRADVDWSALAKANHESTLHVEMLLLFVFMALVVVLLVVTETFIKLPLMRLEQAMKHPEEQDSGIPESSNENDEIARVARAYTKTRKDQ
jgi:hypothetical protein